MKSLKQVYKLYPHGYNAFETKMPIIPFKNILNTKSQLLLNDVRLASNLAKAIHHRKTYKFFVTEIFHDSKLIIIHVQLGIDFDHHFLFGVPVDC